MTFKRVKNKETGRYGSLMSIDCLGAVVAIVCLQLGGEYAVNEVFKSGPLHWRFAVAILKHK